MSQETAEKPPEDQGDDGLPEQDVQAHARSKTIRIWNGSSKKRLLPLLDEDGNVIDTENLDRPQTRSECVEGHRPCPFVGCKYHLYLDVTRTGNIKLNFPDTEVWELDQSCALDIADKGSTTLKVVGELMNLTRERARQLEKTILFKVQEILQENGIG